MKRKTIYNLPGHPHLWELDGTLLWPTADRSEVPSDRAIIDAVAKIEAERAHGPLAYVAIDEYARALGLRNTAILAAKVTDLTGRKVLIYDIAGNDAESAAWFNTRPVLWRHPMIHWVDAVAQSVYLYHWGVAAAGDVLAPWMRYADTKIRAGHRVANGKPNIAYIWMAPGAVAAGTETTVAGQVADFLLQHPMLDGIDVWGTSPINDAMMERVKS